jgi:hypothetical protein
MNSQRFKTVKTKGGSTWERQPSWPITEGMKTGRGGLALRSHAQTSMIDFMGMSFISMYKVIGPFLFFKSLLLMVWGGFWLIVKVSLRVAITMRSVWIIMRVFYE